MADRHLTVQERVRRVLFPILWALIASAMLVESDVYRYVTIILVIFAFVWEWSDVKRVSRDWLALLCYAWSAYAAIRFTFGVFVSGEKGTSEWLYIFPVFFPLLGVALHASRRYIFSATTLLVACGLLALLATVDFQLIFAGERAPPLFHNNPIHAGIGSCMLFLTAAFWLLHAAETGQMAGRFKWLFLILGVATAALSLIGVLGSQSKGAWLALAATIVFMTALILLRHAGKWRLHLVGGVLFASIGLATIVTPYVEKVAETTMDATVQLVDDTISTAAPFAATQKSIVDPATPESMRERLKLWSNAAELIQAAPWVGWGNAWLAEWRKTTYSDVEYDLIHNGYLEIMVRHGLLGIAFLLVFAFAAIRSISDAYRHDLVSFSLAAFLCSISFFFFCTIATNSNNRLAIGESFFICAGAAIFALRLGGRKRGIRLERLDEKGHSAQRSLINARI